MTEPVSPPRRVTHWWNRIFPEVLTRVANLDWVAQFDPRVRQFRDPVTGRFVGREEGRHRRETVAKWNTITRIERYQEDIGRPVGWRGAKTMYDDAIETTEGLPYEERENAIRRLVSP